MEKVDIYEGESIDVTISPMDNTLRLLLRAFIFTFVTGIWAIQIGFEDLSLSLGG